MSSRSRNCTLVERAALRSHGRGVRPELGFALRLHGIARLALGTAAGALTRTESRGAHYRGRQPGRDDARWLGRRLARWPESASGPLPGYAPVGPPDMPPGRRGSGSSTCIDLDVSVEGHCAGVAEAWRAPGAPEPAAALGAGMRPGGAGPKPGAAAREVPAHG